ncbi:hypothetical protein DID80_03170 [Candidatus Marinamargulisbacteria bacterium SCGC AAA071-K20]|nr:hypothetical protein DID80_03170 [Candidatus Marinamargulisbacteria bacterium SCGC AAA071-K20]
MSKVLISLLTIITLSTSILGADINDVSESDAAYKAIEKSVNNGYLPLDNTHNFKPNRSISRRELAISINKLIEEIQKQNISLSPTEIRELNHLSKSFKKSYASNKSRIAVLELKSLNTSNEFDTLHTDITKTNDTLQSELTTIKKQRTYMWIAIVVSTILGLST